MNRSMIPRIFPIALASFTILGCTDKASPEFERCAELQTAKKYNEAREACQRAVAADPESKSGKLAAARIPVIDTETVKADQAERSERAQSDARIAEAEARSASLKAKFDAALAKVAQLQGQLSKTTDPAEKGRLEAELAAAMKDKNTAGAEIRGGNAAPNGKPCNCPPGDPLCSCL